MSARSLLFGFLVIVVLIFLSTLLGTFLAAVGSPTVDVATLAPPAVLVLAPFALLVATTATSSEER